MYLHFICILNPSSWFDSCAGYTGCPRLLNLLQFPEKTLNFSVSFIHQLNSKRFWKGSGPMRL